MKLDPGKKRQWVRCNKCRRVAYFDYTPYSLSNPIMTLPCGCLITGRFRDFVTYITADEAFVELGGLL
jgi:hypothetical protein